METFGKRLRDLRIEKGIAQETLAKELGVSKSQISAWELNQNEPTMSKLVLLAKYFKVTTDYLCGLED